MPAPAIHFDGSVQRRVLLAVELHDPLAPGLVWRGVDVTAEGLSGRAIVSHSGRFVWLREGDAWPSRITVDTGRLPYAPTEAVLPPRPADFDRPGLDEQRVRIVLRPSPAYGFGPGVTAVRGTLREHLGQDAAPVPGARVTLAWRRVTPSAGWVEAALPATTDATGEFAVFLRLQPQPPAQPDLRDRLLRVQLVVERDTKRRTPDDFRFEADRAVPVGRLREGFPLAQPLRLGWQELTT